MKRVLFLIVVLALFVLTVSLADSAQKTYTFNEYGFTVSLPDTYTLLTQDELAEYSKTLSSLVDIENALFVAFDGNLAETKCIAVATADYGTLYQDYSFIGLKDGDVLESYSRFSNMLSSELFSMFTYSVYDTGSIKYIKGTAEQIDDYVYYSTIYNKTIINIGLNTKGDQTKTIETLIDGIRIRDRTIWDKALEWVSGVWENNKLMVILFYGPVALSIVFGAICMIVELLKRLFRIK